MIYYVLNCIKISRKQCFQIINDANSALLSSSYSTAFSKQSAHGPSGLKHHFSGFCSPKKSRDIPCISPFPQLLTYSPTCQWQPSYPSRSRSRNLKTLKFHNGQRRKHDSMIFHDIPCFSMIFHDF